MLKQIRLKTGVVLLLNGVILLLAVQMVDTELAETTSPVKIRTTMPLEAELPVTTITDEMKIGMFFDDLSMDPDVLPSRIMQSLEPWEPYIERYSKQYNIDSDLIRAIIFAESRGNPYSVSKDGAQGLMQIMPSTATYLGVEDAMDPESNIYGGVKYIARLVRRYDETRALWAWNAGPSKLERNHMPLETKRFIVKVLTIKSYLKDSRNRAI